MLLLRFDHNTLPCSVRPAASSSSHPTAVWTRSGVVSTNLVRHRPHSLNHISYPPPPYSSHPSSCKMDDPSTPFLNLPPSTTAGSARQQQLTPFSEAAKALLSSPLPPELVVDFKGSSAPTPSHLRNSTSESNVHDLPAGHNPDGIGCGASGSGPVGACRTLSDGAKKSYARRKLESEDSSYDSDYECSDSMSLALASPSSIEPTSLLTSAPSASSSGTTESSSPSQQQHEDISRTVSDTLAAEFSEYVCVYNPSFQRLKETSGASDDDGDDDDSDSSSSSDSSDESGTLINDPSYASRVEFALKLGYTELQVQKALAKLGAQPAQNELLAELIRLASLPGSSSTGSSGSIAEGPVTEAVHRPLSVTYSDETLLRQIVIDGSNVAISHGNKEVFSCRGIQLCVDWFRNRGHRKITVFVPMWRKETSRIDTPITNQEILLELEKERILVFTPSRQVGGRRLVCYDDRYILRLAAETDGIVVSNDNYRDLVSENPEYRRIVEERILMYSFVNDRFMPPEDPLGRNGPKLDRFLRKPLPPAAIRAGVDPSVAGATTPPCPYGKKCTYGNKCKYYHPERGNIPQKTITERLAEHAQRSLQEVKARSAANAGRNKALMPTCKTLSLPLSGTSKEPVSVASSSAAGKPPSPVKKTPLARTKSIVPSLSLLPPELTEERPVQDVPSSSSTDRPILKSRSVENMAQIKQQQMLRGPPPPTFTVPPPMTVPSWTAGHQQHPQHLTLCQQLSDPPAVPLETKAPSPEDPASYNPHRKVQRQLTLNPLNPTCDPRLYTLKGLAPPYPPPPLAVHHHLQVTRNASAPAPASQLCPPSSSSSSSSSASSHRHGVFPVGGAPHMQRLNSTSDTQLNLYGAVTGSQDWGHDPFDGSSEWTIKSPPPPLPVQPQQQQQHQWAARTSSLPAAQHHRLLSSSPVQQPFNDSNSSLASSSGSGIANQAVSEARYKLFFHLAAIFPEEQVRHVLNMMPDETNAQKICAAILALYPKEP